MNESQIFPGDFLPDKRKIRSIGDGKYIEIVTLITLEGFVKQIKLDPRDTCHLEPKIIKLDLTNIKSTQVTAQTNMLFRRTDESCQGIAIFREEFIK
jgi:hypothetical protein